MKVSLVVLSTGKSAGQAIPVTLSQFIIGRDPQCNLRPASAVISKRHCAILTNNGKVLVRDFESTNGTFVNETPVKGEFPLNHEDILKVGPLAFRVIIENTTPVNKPTPLPTKRSAAGKEDDIAAMLLLSLQEAEAPAAGESNSSDESSDVPGGSTIMDMIPLPDTDTAVPVASASTAAVPPARAAASKAPAPAVAAPNVSNPAPITVAKAHTAPAPVPATGPAALAVPAVAAVATPSAATPAPTPAPAAAKAAEKPADKHGEKPKDNKPAENKPQPTHATARDAARAILEKYTKRHRS